MVVDNSEKQQRELRVFQEFIERSGLAIVSGSIESRNSPEPDMLCNVIGEDCIAFELKEVCDPRLAEVVSKLSRGKSKKLEAFRFGFSLDDFMRRARAKKYTSDYPMELIFYTSGRTLFPSDQIVPKVRLYFDNDCHKFRRVWFLGEPNDTCECVCQSSEAHG